MEEEEEDEDEPELSLSEDEVECDSTSGDVLAASNSIRHNHLCNADILLFICLGKKRSLVIL